MKLKEFEGKQLFKDSTIQIPSSTLILKKDLDNLQINLENKVLKVQILSGKRGKHNGILFPKSQEEGKELLEELFSKEILGEKIEEVLIEEKLDIKEELYLGILFDSKENCPILIFSEKGGINIEEVPKEDINIEKINILEGITDEFLKKINITNDKINTIISKLYECFKKNDLKMVEINPLCITNSGNIIAADSVVVLDDNALKRHSFNFPKRSGNREKTSRELRANSIDENDHRGVCGSTFIDLDGDIATLSSGGGASITALDAILSYGGKIANYTEYSGNPPEEKVKKLTQIVLEPENLNGLFIVGGRANFTRIDITLQAILDIIIEKEISFPIVVRRAGPGDEQAFKIFKEAAEKYNLNVKLFDDSIPISLAAKVMVEEAIKYKNGNTLK